MIRLLLPLFVCTTAFAVEPTGKHCVVNALNTAHVKKMAIHLDKAVATLAFYRGERIEREDILKLMKRWKVVYFYDPETRIGVLTSTWGRGHDELIKLVPPGAKIEGGTRYTAEKALIDSTIIGHGTEFQNEHIEVFFPDGEPAPR